MAGQGGNLRGKNAGMIRRDQLPDVGNMANARPKAENGRRIAHCFLAITSILLFSREQ